METAITTIAAIGNNTQHDTSVTLEQRDGQYHLTHVWIAGKTYGYELPVDGNRQLASKSDSEKMTLAGSYVPNQPAPAPEQPKQEPQQVAQAAPTPTPDPARSQIPETPAQPVTQAEPAPPQAAVTPEPVPEPAKPAEMAAQTPPMPATATYWPDLLLGGSVLLLLGLVVRPKSPPVA